MDDEPSGSEQFTLDSGSKICAEIFRNETTGLYSFVCFYCGHICRSFENINTHINDSHFTDDDDFIQDNEHTSVEIKCEDSWDINDCGETTTTFPTDENHGETTLTTDRQTLLIPSKNEVVEGKEISESDAFIRKEVVQCDLCSKTLSKRSIGSHMRLHRGEKPYSCKFCEKSFSAKNSLNFHLRLHATDYKKIQCDICSKTIHSENLKLHMRTHTGEKPHQCKVCKRCFTFHTSLNRHIKQHADDNDKFFKLDENQHSEQLSSEIKTEEPLLSADNQNVQCNICSKTVLSQNLKYHKRIHTSSGKKNRYECQFCEETFRFLFSLRTHLELHANDNQKTKIFAESISSETKNKKKLNCKWCEKSFATKRERYGHTTRFHNPYMHKKVECDICSKTLLKGHLKEHMRIHTGENPFKCKICEKYFSFKSSLNRHMRLLHSMPPKENQTSNDSESVES